MVTRTYTLKVAQAAKPSRIDYAALLNEEQLAAVEAGADVYCQKPISVDIAEGQAMLAAARRTKRVVQIGTQRRSTPHLIEAKEQFIDSGRLGKIAGESHERLEGHRAQQPASDPIHNCSRQRRSRRRSTSISRRRRSPASSRGRSTGTTSSSSSI